MGQDQDPAATVRALWEGGDRDAAYRHVVETTQDSLYRFLVHMLRDTEAAREVFQDAYIRVFRGLGSFRGEASLTTWVLTVGRNTALNHLRSRKSREGRSDSWEDQEVEPVPGKVGVGEDAMWTRSLREAVSALPETQREAVLLYYLEDRSLNEVAEMTGRTPNTVKSDLLRARKRLRDQLEDREP